MQQHQQMQPGNAVVAVGNTAVVFSIVSAGAPDDVAFVVDFDVVVIKVTTTSNKNNRNASNVPTCFHSIS